MAVWSVVKTSGMTHDIRWDAEHYRPEYLRQERIRVLAEDLGSTFPRKVYFFPQTGKVMVKQLRSLHNDTIYTREKHYAAQLDVVSVTGAADLFK